MTTEIEFSVNRKAFRLTDEQVERAMNGVEPEPVRSHAVVVEGRVYPVKQVFAVATGLDRLDFTSAVARRNLNRLGFELFRKNPS